MGKKSGPMEEKTFGYMVFLKLKNILTSLGKKKIFQPY